MDISPEVLAALRAKASQASVTPSGISPDVLQALRDKAAGAYKAEGTLSDTLSEVAGAGMRAADMATFGLSTKVGSGLSALFSKAASPFTGEERGLGELYQDSLQANKDQMSDLPSIAKYGSSGVGLVAGAPVQITKAVGIIPQAAKAANAVQGIKGGKVLLSALTGATEGAGQAALDAYGHDQEVENPAIGGGIFGSVIGGASPLLGKVAESAGDFLRLRGLGISKSAINKSAKQAGYQNVPVKENAFKLEDEGFFNGTEYKAKEVRGKIIEDVKKIENNLTDYYKGIDEVKDSRFTPNFSITDKYVKAYKDPHKKEKILKIYNEIKNSLKANDNGTVTLWANTSEGLGSAAKGKYGEEAQQIEAEIKKLMSRDIKNSLDSYLVDLNRKGIIDFEAIRNIRSWKAAQRKRLSILDAVNQQVTDEAEGGRFGKLLNMPNILSTTGGMGVPLLLGAYNPAIGALALGGYGALGTRTGQRNTGKLLNKIASSNSKKGIGLAGKAISGITRATQGDPQETESVPLNYQGDPRSLVAAAESPLGSRSGSFAQKLDKRVLGQSSQAMSDLGMNKEVSKGIRSRSSFSNSEINSDPMQGVSAKSPELEAFFSEMHPLVKAIVKTESDFNPRAQSKKGARGLMQIMPEWDSKLGINNAFDPYENVNAGIEILNQEIDRYGSPVLALAAYNAGSPAVNAAIRKAGSREWSKIKKYLKPETQQYVVKVLKNYNEFSKG